MKQPLTFFPKLVTQMRKMGYEKEIPVKIFKTEYMRLTGILNRKTVDRWISCLEDLGYIKFLNDDIICFGKIIEKQIMKEVENDGK